MMGGNLGAFHKDDKQVGKLLIIQGMNPQFCPIGMKDFSIQGVCIV